MKGNTASYLRRNESSLARLFFPEKCAFCGRPLEKGSVCSQCRRSLPYTGLTAGTRMIKNVDRFVSPLYYEDEVRRSILGYKFFGDIGNCRAYAALIAECLREQGIEYDLITWVPLSRRHLRRRGYDQAELIADELAALTGRETTRLLTKVRENKTQSRVRGRENRLRNVHGVYEVSSEEKCRGVNVLLVDDIVTTGATVSECARVLRGGGAGKIYVTAAAVKKV